MRRMAGDPLPRPLSYEERGARASAVAIRQDGGPGHPRAGEGGRQAGWGPGNRRYTLWVMA